MSLDSAAKIAQIAFYLVAGTVAVLTFRSARYGLLNSVNTEYKKRVMDRLADLSRELFREFDETSDHHWVKQPSSTTEATIRINDEYRTGRHGAFSDGRYVGGFPITTHHRRMTQMSDSIKTDPFIPEEIRAPVLRMLNQRLELTLEAERAVIGRYANGLAIGKYKPDDNHAHWLHNQVLEMLYAENAGTSQVEGQVHNIRRLMQDYLESFDPLNGQRKKKTRRQSL